MSSTRGIGKGSVAKHGDGNAQNSIHDSASGTRVALSSPSEQWVGMPSGGIPEGGNLPPEKDGMGQRRIAGVAARNEETLPPAALPHRRHCRPSPDCGIVAIAQGL